MENGEQDQLIQNVNLIRCFVIFTYFQLINICYPYKFVDILMNGVLKVVEKCKIY